MTEKPIEPGGDFFSRFVQDAATWSGRSGPVRRLFQSQSNASHGEVDMPAKKRETNYRRSNLGTSLLLANSEISTSDTKGIGFSVAAITCCDPKLVGPWRAVPVPETNDEHVSRPDIQASREEDSPESATASVELPPERFSTKSREAQFRANLRVQNEDGLVLLAIRVVPDEANGDVDENAPARESDTMRRLEKQGRNPDDIPPSRALRLTTMSHRGL